MAEFATRLKELRKNKKIRQVDLAKEIGVAQTTIANYEQHSRFPDEATLRGIANFFNVSLDYLLGRSESNVVEKQKDHLVLINPAENELSTPSREYLQLLLDGERARAYELVLDSVRKGTPVRTIYSEIFEPSLKEVGRLWETNQLDIAQEHFFSEATESLMAQLYPFLRRPLETKGVFVSTSINGEFHHIGLKMLTDILEEEGWKCFYLGINTPTLSLIQALKQRKADILAVSATMPFHVDTVKTVIHAIRSELSNTELRIIAGGQAFNGSPDLWKSIGADGFAGDLISAIELVKRFEPESDEIRSDLA
jgi:methanogenic corrinoid protein MtbC1